MTTTTAELVLTHDLDGYAVNLRRADGYVSATGLCKAAGKLWADYRRLDSTEAFLTEISAVMGIPITELAQVQQGGRPHEQGTWVHPDVAIHLAQWCSPRFAVQVSKWVRELMTTGRVELTPQPDSLTRAVDQMVAMVTMLTNRVLALEQNATGRPGVAAIMADTQKKIAELESLLNDPPRLLALRPHVKSGGGWMRFLARMFGLAGQSSVERPMRRTGWRAKRNGDLERIDAPDPKQD